MVASGKRKWQTILDSFYITNLRFEQSWLFPVCVAHCANEESKVVDDMLNPRSCFAFNFPGRVDPTKSTARVSISIAFHLPKLVIVLADDRAQWIPSVVATMRRLFVSDQTVYSEPHASMEFSTTLYRWTESIHVRSGKDFCEKVDNNISSSPSHTRALCSRCDIFTSGRWWVIIIFKRAKCARNLPEISMNVFAAKQLNCSVARCWLRFQESSLHRTIHFVLVAVAFCMEDDDLLALAAVPVDFQWYSFLLVVALVHCQPLCEEKQIGYYYRRDLCELIRIRNFVHRFACAVRRECCTAQPFVYECRLSKHRLYARAPHACKMTWRHKGIHRKCEL